MGLAITRKSGQRVRIGPDVWVEVQSIRRGVARLIIDAPKEINIVREELVREAEHHVDRKTA